MTERNRFYLLLGGLAMLVVLLFIVSLLTGPAAISIPDSLKALLGDDSEMIVLVMREIRLPRHCLRSSSEPRSDCLELLCKVIYATRSRNRVCLE